MSNKLNSNQTSSTSLSTLKNNISNFIIHQPLKENEVITIQNILILVEPNSIIITVDGLCKGTAIGVGLVITYQHQSTPNQCILKNKFETFPSSLKAEFLAIIQALDICPQNISLIIQLDSQQAINKYSHMQHSKQMLKKTAVIKYTNFY